MISWLSSYGTKNDKFNVGTRAVPDLVFPIRPEPARFEMANQIWNWL